VFADTPYQKKLLIKEFGVNRKKIRVLPLGADNRGYEYSPYKNIHKKRINVVYYGLYSPIHGVEYIIEAANLLKNDRNILFHLVGSGPAYRENYKRAKSLKLRNVRFYPDVREGNHLKYLQNADVFLGFLQEHPSVERVVGNKVYQGMALGRPVLTADAPVTRSMFLHKQNVYLCKPADSQALASALIELKNKPKLRARIARNSYRLYLDKYTPKVVSGRLAGFMKPVVRNYMPWRARFTTSLSSFVVTAGEYLEYLFELH
jgi:glycosyltransferase involved in cell wall biosynthesis